MKIYLQKRLLKIESTRPECYEVLSNLTAAKIGGAEAGQEISLCHYLFI